MGSITTEVLSLVESVRDRDHVGIATDSSVSPVCSLEISSEKEQADWFRGLPDVSADEADESEQSNAGPALEASATHLPEKKRTASISKKTKLEVHASVPKKFILEEQKRKKKSTWFTKGQQRRERFNTEHRNHVHKQVPRNAHKKPTESTKELLQENVVPCTQANIQPPRRSERILGCCTAATSIKSPKMIAKAHHNTQLRMRLPSMG